MHEEDRLAKANLRTEMKAKLAAMSAEARHDASVSSCQRLMQLDSFRNATVVMLYMPLAREVDLTPAAVRCFQLGKTVCVPKVSWQRRDMSAVGVTSFDDDVMDIDDHGLRSPREGQPIVPHTIDLIVVPGLAFDAQGHRLGRGGGFYDRFLGRLRHAAATVALAFDFQIIDLVPADDRDVSVETIVTERRVIGPVKTKRQG